MTLNVTVTIETLTPCQLKTLARRETGGEGEIRLANTLPEKDPAMQTAARAQTGISA